MKRIALSLLVSAVLAAIAWAQGAPQQVPAATPQGTTSPAPTTQTKLPSQIPGGTIIYADLSKSIDAKKAKVGDPVEAKTTVDLLFHGQIVVPRDTKITGHVTAVKTHTKESPNSMLAIVFDHILKKGAPAEPLQATIQAIGRPLQTAAAFAENRPFPDATSGVSGSVEQEGMGGPIRTGSAGSMPSTFPPSDRSGSRPDVNPPSSSTVAPLGPSSKGVIGIKELSLSVSAETSTINSATSNVHLDNWTQLVLRVQ